MSSSFTVTNTITFTATHARHLAAKVATDLKRMQRFYNYPNDQDILDYESEMIALLKNGYLERVSYGFRRKGEWISPTLRYTAHDLNGASAQNDDPGLILPGNDISGAVFYSFLVYSSAWLDISTADREAFKRILPFGRNGANEPGINGYLVDDRTYSSGGRALNRASVRSF